MNCPLCQLEVRSDDLYACDDCKAEVCEDCIMQTGEFDDIQMLCAECFERGKK